MPEMSCQANDRAHSRVRHNLAYDVHCSVGFVCIDVYPAMQLFVKQLMVQSSRYCMYTPPL